MDKLYPWKERNFSNRILKITKQIKENLSVACFVSDRSEEGRTISDNLGKGGGDFLG